MIIGKVYRELVDWLVCELCDYQFPCQMALVRCKKKKTNERKSYIIIFKNRFSSFFGLVIYTLEGNILWFERHVFMVDREAARAHASEYL